MTVDNEGGAGRRLPHADDLTGQRTITSEGRVVAQVRVVELDEARTIGKRVAGVPDPTRQANGRYRAEVNTPSGVAFSVIGETPGDALMRCGDAILSDVRESRMMMAALKAFVNGETDL